MNFAIFAFALHFTLAAHAHAIMTAPVHHSHTLAWTSALLVAVTVADVETTFAGLKRGGFEANPIMKPFVSNRLTAYAFRGGIDALAIWMAHKYRRPWFPVVVAIPYGVAAGWNIHVGD